MVSSKAVLWIKEWFTFTKVILMNFNFNVKHTTCNSQRGETKSKTGVNAFIIYIITYSNEMK